MRLEEPGIGGREGRGRGGGLLKVARRHGKEGKRSEDCREVGRRDWYGSTWGMAQVSGVPHSIKSAGR